MIKNSLLALTTAALVAGVALPAFAAPVPVESSDVTSTETDGIASDYTLLRLHEKGVKATSIEEWNGLVRAFVVQDDGTQAMRFFDPDTLAPVEL